MFKIITATFVFTSVLLLSACGGSSSSLRTGDTELNLAAKEAIDNTIIPASYRFQQLVTKLVSDSNNFCSSNNQTAINLTSLQNQWIETNFAWYELLPYLFGPMVNSEVLPTYIFIDYFRQRGDNDSGVIRSNIDSLLASTTDEEYDSSLSNLGANSLGLLAIEVSVFEDAANQSIIASDILLEFQNNPRKCQLLIDLGNKLLARADEVHYGWTVNYRETGKSYRDLVVKNQLEVALDDDSGESAIKKITLSVQEFYDYLGKRNITTNAAQLSNSIWLALDKSLSSTEELLSGSASTELSLNRIMTNNRFEKTVILLSDNITTLRTALVENNSIDMVAAAKALDGNFKREVPEALNINLGLNFSDGD
jgi:predicted lipoprotein